MASLVAQMVKNLPAMWETLVWSLGWENSLQKGKATLPNTCLENSLDREKPGRLQSMGLKRVRHHCDPLSLSLTHTHTHTHTHTEKPEQIFWPSQYFPSVYVPLSSVDSMTAGWWLSCSLLLNVWLREHFDTSNKRIYLCKIHLAEDFLCYLFFQCLNLSV